MKILSTPRNRLTVTASIISLGVSAIFSPQIQAAGTIDVLVLYTPGTAERYNGNPETRINHLFNVSNQVYRDSGLDLQIRPVHLEQVDYPDNTSSTAALYDVTLKLDPAFSSVEQLREEYGADMVLMYRPYTAEQGNCGVAWIGGYNSNGDFSAPWLKSYMYSHVSISTCGDYVTAHELGHNMGLNHSRLQNGSGGTFDYALGHGEHNNFVTMMAYQSAFNVNYWSGKIYKFSSPDLECNGLPCGIDKNDPVSGADAVAALRVTTPQIADYFPSKSVEEPQDDGLAELKAQLEQLQSTYDQILSKYIDATATMKEQRAAYIEAINAYRQELTSYRQVYADFIAARTGYIQAYRNYISARRSGNSAAITTAYSQLISQRSNYLESRNTLLTARTSYLAGIAELRSARNTYIDAIQLVRTVRDELNAAKQELIAAKQSYIDAGGIV
jgi:hypothetical protein